jgi:hypothetical protein
MVILGKLFDAGNNGCGPLNDKVFQTITLVEVSIHVLFHSFLGLLALLAFNVKLHLICIHIMDKFFELLHRQSPLLGRTDRDLGTWNPCVFFESLFLLEGLVVTLKDLLL